MSLTERYFPDLSKLNAEQWLVRLFLVNFVTVFIMIPTGLTVVGLFSVETYFVISFITFLISSEVIPPSDLRSIWWTRLQVIKAGGWVVFVYIISQRVVAVLQ